MNIIPINTDHTLFAVNEIFPTEIADQIKNLDWRDLTKDKSGNLSGDNNRYNIDLPQELFRTVDNYIRWTTLPYIESTLNIKFETTQDAYLICWLCEPGYISGIHIDGTIPATMQVYWEPTDRNDCGTYFYNTHSSKDVLHYFENVPNTGYLTLAKTAKSPLWHGTKRPLGADVLRVCFMIVLPDYTVL